MKLNYRLLLILLGLSAASSHGAQLGVNFAGNDRGKGIDATDYNLFADSTAGRMPQAHWNDVRLNSGAIEDLMNQAGTASGVSVSWSADGKGRVKRVGVQNDNVLMNGYICAEKGKSEKVEVSFANLNQFVSSYDVYVYIGMGTDNQRKTGTLTDGTTRYADFKVMSGAVNTFPDAYTLIDGDGVAGNYALFSGLTSDTVTITYTRGSNNGGIHGVQIVDSVLGAPAPVVRTAPATPGVVPTPGVAPKPVAVLEPVAPVVKKTFAAMAAPTKFKISLKDDKYSIPGKWGTFESLAPRINGQSLFKSATREHDGIVSSSVQGVDVELAFEWVEGGWLKIGATLVNNSDKTVELKTIDLLEARLPDMLQSKKPLKFYWMTDSIWSKRGINEVKTQAFQGLYTAALYTPDAAQSWVVAYNAPQLWRSSISVDGPTKTLKAFVDFEGIPFPLEPGEKITLDSLVISGDMNLKDGLMSLGKTFYSPRRPLEEIRDFANYNTWEYTQRECHEKYLDPVLDALAANETTAEACHYFVIDDGWFKDPGVWTAYDVKMPSGVDGWIKKVEAHGLIPGCWIAPYLMAGPVAEEHGFKLFDTSDKTGGAMEVVKSGSVDISQPGVQEFYLSQIRGLRAAGFKFFKTDFLRNGYRSPRDYAYSKWPAEKVMYDYHSRIREAVGDDAFWLACGTTFSSSAGLADGARIGGDTKANWKHVQKIAKWVGFSFWMHGNLWWNDPDFLVVKGPETLKEGAVPHRTGNNRIPYDGFTLEEAKCLSTLIIASGGMMSWSDNPELIPEAMDVVEKTFENAGGSMGIPLDFGIENVSGKWLRIEKDRCYIGLINWKDEVQKFEIDLSGYPEVAGSYGTVDLFSGEKVPVKNGRISLTLPPHTSRCLIRNR